MKNNLQTSVKQEFSILFLSTLEFRMIDSVESPTLFFGHWEGIFSIHVIIDYCLMLMTSTSPAQEQST